MRIQSIRFVLFRTFSTRHVGELRSDKFPVEFGNFRTAAGEILSCKRFKYSDVDVAEHFYSIG